MSVLKIKKIWILSISALFLSFLCALPSVIKLAGYPDYPGSDDAFIHLAIIENIHRGHGWGINENKPVFMSTSPLFTVLFSALRKVTPEVLEVGMVLSSIAGAMYILGMFVLGCRVSGGRSRAWGFMAAFLAATNIHLWHWTGTFMEVTLAMAVVVWLTNGFLALHDVPVPRRAMFFGLFGVGLGLGVLIRPELGLLGVAFLAHRLATDKSRVMRDFAPMAGGFALVLLPALGVLYVYFGTILPTTLPAKASPQLIWFNIPVWKQLFKVVSSGCLGIFLLTVIIWIMIRPSAEQVCRQAKTATVLWLFPLLGFVFYSLTMPGLQSAARYNLPFLALMPALVASIAGACSPVRYRPILLLTMALCLLQFAAALVWKERLLRPALTRMVDGYVNTMREAADRIGLKAKRGDAVLVYVDIGVVALNRPAGVRILDGGGLASPELHGLTLPAMVRTSSPRFVLESIGTGERTVERSLEKAGEKVRLVWSRSFPSHNIEYVGEIYEARLYELEKAK